MDNLVGASRVDNISSSFGNFGIVPSITSEYHYAEKENIWLAMAIIQNVSIALAVIASLGAVLYKPLSLRIEVLGINRPLNKIVNIHGEDFQIIPDTLYTEDLHHHLPSGLLFGASEENPETRYKWFPP